ncbi:MAG: type III pantothenate kinase [Pyrinomonadaceae bacterium]|nr:type III pantothenate kinase [Pyrinomonadaceae bacterium]
MGNSAAKFGIFSQTNLISRFTIPTVRTANANAINLQIQNYSAQKFSAVVISSVVPELNDAYRKFAEKFHHLEAVFVDNTFDFGLKINYHPPKNVGVDRIIAAFAAVEKYGKPCIVGDFGTATTIDAVNSRGEYLGGIIAAGMSLLADALARKTSKLPRVEIRKPEKVIGSSTIRSIQSGIYFGYVGLVDGIISRMIDELGEMPRVIATGGFAEIIAESSVRIEIVDETLMLDGLRLIYEKTISIKPMGEIND